MEKDKFLQILNFIRTHSKNLLFTSETSLAKFDENKNWKIFYLRKDQTESSSICHNARVQMKRIVNSALMRPQPLNESNLLPDLFY